MPDYDDSGFFRPQNSEVRRDVIGEIRNHTTANFKNFQWGRVALAAVPAVLAVGGVWWIADASIGEQTRLDAAPKVTLGEVTKQLKDCRTKNFHPRIASGEKVEYPRYLEISGFASLASSKEISTTNGNYLVKTFRMSDISSAAPVENNFSSVNLSNANFTSATNIASGAVADTFSIFIETRIRTDNPNPFDGPLGGNVSGAQVSVVVGIKPQHLVRNTNSAVFRALAVHSKE